MDRYLTDIVTLDLKRKYVDGHRLNSRLVVHSGIGHYLYTVLIYLKQLLRRTLHSLNFFVLPAICLQILS